MTPSSTSSASSTTTTTTETVMDSIASTVQSIASTTLNAITMSSTNPSTPSHTTASPSSSSSTSWSLSEDNTPTGSSHGPSVVTMEALPSTTIDDEAGIAIEKMLNVGDLSSSLQHFGWVDYFVFVMMLVVCAVIGFYFGFIEKKGKGREQRRGSEALDYLVGGRKMKVFPVSLSLVASFVSGISLLGTSTEIYVYGTQYAFILITIGISAVISWYIFLPVFCNLQLTSTYEYFEMRFDRRIRIFGSVLFAVGVVVWLPIAVYVPALTFNQVTGIDIHVITPIVCLVCTFYTCVGGLKAVVWTDVIQSFIMFGSIFLVMIKGTFDLGGFGVVWQRNADSGRLTAPEMSLDPTVRLSVLSVFIGGTLHKLQSSAVNQITIQRFISLPSLKKSKQTLIIFTIGLILLLSCCAYIGLLTFATYHDCDPLSTKLAKATDQLVPLLVMHILGIFPGLPGLFVSGVFSAALSSLSTGLNSLACVILEDFIKPVKTLTERQTAFILRFVVAFFGLTCIGLVFVVEKLGMVLQLATTVGAVTQGPLLGIFFMGICMPWINGKSALTGSIVSFAVMGWTCIKAQIALATGELRFEKKPVSVEGCTYSFDNSTITSTVFTPPEKAFHHISFMWYSAFGGALCIIVACLATFFFGKEDIDALDDSLFAPCVRRLLRSRRRYSSVQLEEKLEHLKAVDYEKNGKRLSNDSDVWNGKN